jgi:hypothetical protein
MDRLKNSPKHLTLKQINEKAQDFFKGNKGYDKIPVPIEEIVCRYYKYEIIPASNLYRDIGIEGYVVPHKKEMYIDELVYDNTSPNRFNSTLAHEVGHLVLHHELMRKFKNEEEVLGFLTSYDEESLDWVEKQAWTYARYLLLPSHRFDKKLKEFIIERKLESMLPMHIPMLLKTPIAKHFEVADHMAKIRIQMHLETGI